jgi:hypothetical protein
MIVGISDQYLVISTHDHEMGRVSRGR